jgi:hypothetical protein
MADQSQSQPPRQPAPGGGCHPCSPRLIEGLRTTGTVTGIFGVAFGVVSLLFCFAWSFGLVAVVGGVIGGEQT